MKKIYAIAIFAILFSMALSCNAQICKTNEKLDGEWTGSIRIEGKEDTVWAGTVTISETDFEAKNVDTQETNNYHISYPSALGALVEAANLGDFSISIEYWPSWESFLVKSVQEDSDWWQYFVDYESLMVGADAYELTEEDDGIIWGYIETFPAHLLKINVDKSEVQKDEEFTITVIDEADLAVEDAIVYVNSDTYTTDSQGKVTTALSDGGSYKIYAQKAGYIRSEDEIIVVKKKSRSKEIFSNILFEFLERFPNLERYIKF